MINDDYLPIKELPVNNRTYGKPELNDKQLEKLYVRYQRDAILGNYE